MPTDPKMVGLDEIALLEMGQSPDSQSVNESDDGIPFLQGNAEFGVVYPNHRLTCFQPTKLCQRGDILISVRAPVGALNKADRVYCIGRGLAAVRFTGVAPDYGWHLLNYWARDLQRVAQGSTFTAISKSNLATLKVLWVATDEQKRIADILDTADVAIQQTEALIAKLKQVKVGLLHDLLTYGLDENGQLRDPVAHPEQFKEVAGWRGRVPKEWDWLPISALSVYITYGFTNPMPTTNDGPWMVTAADIVDNQIQYNTARHTSFRDYWRLTAKSRPLVGDILITKDGTLGRIAIVDRADICINQSVACIRPKSDADTRFLVHYLCSPEGQQRILADAGGSTIKHIYISKLGDMTVPIPLDVERKQISDVLDTHDTRIRSEESYLGKLRAIKQGLMHDLLTGKVRV